MSDSRTAYTIVSAEKTDQGLKAEIALNEEDALFEGHFPENPIMPGVLNVEIIEHLLGTELTLQVKQINQMKFLRPIVPKNDEHLFYELDINDKSDGRKVLVAQGKSGNTVFVKIQLEVESKS